MSKLDVKRSTWRVTVVCMITDPADMDSDDRDFFGEVATREGIEYNFLFGARTKRQAEDLFHETVPIGCLDDFMITTERVE